MVYDKEMYYKMVTMMSTFLWAQPTTAAFVKKCCPKPFKRGVMLFSRKDMRYMGYLLEDDILGMCWNRPEYITPAAFLRKVKGEPFNHKLSRLCT